MSNDSILFFKMIRDFLEIYLPKQKATSKHTIKSYRTALNQYLDFSVPYLEIKMSEFTFMHTSIKLVEAFLEYGEETLNWSAGTRNLKLAAIRSFYKYTSNHEISLMIYYKELEGIPVKNGTKTKEIEFFSEEVLKILLEQPDIRKNKEIRNLMIMILMYDTGARIQELLDLKISDMHIETTSPYVSLTGKGSKTRLVPLMSKTVDHLKKYLKQFHNIKSNGNDYLFYTIHNGKYTQMSQDNVQKFLDKYCQEASKINKDVSNHIYCHMFRHSRAMHLYRNGMPLPLVSEWLGHAQVNTTREFYANADVEMKRNAIESATSKINPILLDDYDFDFQDDEELLKKLYGLK